MQKWIGLTGRAGAGKDFTFLQLEIEDQGLKRVSFADGLRHDIQDAFGMELEALWEKPYSDEIRRLLQWWGTDFRRAQEENYWVKRAERIAYAASKQGFTPVFTDVRFPNEAKMIRSHGGIIVRVEAPQSTRERRLGTLPPEHESEVAIDGIEVDLIINSIASDAYARQVRRILVESRVYDLVESIRESFH